MKKKHTIRFTKDVIEALPNAEPGKRPIYYHKKINGLGVRVTDAGVKTFVFYRWVNSRPSIAKLGRFPDMKIAEAVKKAETYAGTVAGGGDPSADERDRRNVPSLADFFQEYMDRHAKPKKKSWRNDLHLFKKHLTGWHTRKLSTIKRNDVQRLHSEIGKKSGPYAANRVLALLRTIYNKAEAWGDYQGDNPATGVEKFREKSRSRRLRDDERPAFFKALAQEPNTTARDFFYLCLLTGARKANVLAMRWDELALDSETPAWTIPETKGGNTQTVPLDKRAVEILRERQSATDSPWVFPTRDTTSGRRSASGHMTEPKFAWRRILARAGIEGLRIHDLRRTMGSMMAELGTSPAIIKDALGHANINTTMIYARLSQDPVRRSMADAANALFKSAEDGDDDGAEIVPMPKSS